MVNIPTKVRYLHCENGRYFARVPVPLPLRGEYRNNAVKKGLNTADRREACDRLPAAVAAIKDEFRAKLGEVQPTHLEDADPDAIETMVRRGDETWRRFEKWYQFIQTDAGMGLLENPTAPPREAWPALFEILGIHGSTREMEGLTAAMPRLWAQFRKTPHAAKLLDPTIRRMAPEEFYEWILGANKVTVGDVLAAKVKRAIPSVLIPKPMVPDHVKPFSDRFVAPPPEDPITLAELIKTFESDPSRVGNRVETRRNYSTAFAILMETLGAAKNIRHIRRRPDIIKVRDIILSLPPHAKSNVDFAGMTYAQIARQMQGKLAGGEKVTLLDPTTRRKYLRCIGTLFTFAIQENLIDTHPAQGLSSSVEDDREGGREGFTADELRRLFPPEYKLDGVAWMPVVALYSSMRPTEVAQLDVADVIEIEGVWVFDLNEVEGDKRLKNRASIRRIPIHHRLIQLGFLGYHASRKDANERKLFPVAKTSEGYYGCVRDRFAEWFKGCAISKTFHSFRHTWNTAMIGARAHDNLRKVMGGWSVGKGVDVRVYLSTHQLSLADMKTEIDKIDFPVF